MLCMCALTRPAKKNQAQLLLHHLISQKDLDFSIAFVLFEWTMMQLDK